MSNTRCELVNWLLFPLFPIVAAVCFLNLAVLEFYILTGYCVFTLAAHILFGICVVSMIIILLSYFGWKNRKKF